MKIEVCDLCGKRVDKLDSTKVIIKDYKGVSFDLCGPLPQKRRFRGVICDRCLAEIKKGIWVHE